MALNKVIMTGRLTAKPELKKTQTDVSVASFSLAVQRNYKNGSGEYDTDLINCVAWRSQAEFLCKYFDKGQLVTVVGSLTSRRYEDANGNKRTAFEVVCDEVMFAESKGEKTQVLSFIPPTTAGGNDVTFEEFNDDELPF
jgi:single-strand DNA-binding protein